MSDSSNKIFKKGYRVPTQPAAASELAAAAGPAAAGPASAQSLGITKKDKEAFDDTTSTNKRKKLEALKYIQTQLNNRLDAIQILMRQGLQRTLHNLEQSEEKKNLLTKTQLEQNLKTALILINDINKYFKKNNLPFKAVIIGGFAVQQLRNLYKDRSPVIKLFTYSTNDIDVKICGPDNIDQGKKNKLFADIGDKPVEERNLLVIEPGRNPRKDWVPPRALDVTQHPLLPIIRANILSLLTPKIKELNDNIHGKANPWVVYNSSRPAPGPNFPLEPYYPTKVKFNNDEVIDITFALGDDVSILCNTYDYEVMENNEVLLTIPMAKMVALAYNLIYYTSDENLRDENIKKKLGSWIVQIKIVSFALEYEIKKLEKTLSVSSSKGGKKTKNKNKKKIKRKSIKKKKKKKTKQKIKKKKRKTKKVRFKLY